MKRTLNLLAIITLFSFILAACGGQTGRKDTKSDMSDLAEGMQEVIQNIDEAISSNDISEFKNKADDAVGSLDSKIDDYLNEMDKAERRIDKNTQNLVIEMKQKNVEVELKLALLEQDDTKRRDSGTQAYQSDDTRDVSATTQQGATSTLPSDRTVADDRTITSDGRIGTGGDLKRDAETDRAEMYGSQMVDGIKDDLRELKRDVEQFMQTSLSYTDTH